jgi:hypothetical protein
MEIGNDRGQQPPRKLARGEMIHRRSRAIPPVIDIGFPNNFCLAIGGWVRTPVGYWRVDYLEYTLSLRFVLGLAQFSELIDLSDIRRLEC